jgi:hypothetical protein
MRNASEKQKKIEDGKLGEDLFEAGGRQEKWG